MKKIFYIPLSFLLFGLQNIYAQETNFTATYEDYQKNVEQYCESPNRPWAKKNAIVPIPQYPQLDTEKVNQAMEKARNNTEISEAERERILRDLNQDTIARFDGLKVVEVARVQYRTAMNNVFGCSVVDGRLQILGTVKQMIESKTQ